MVIYFSLRLFNAIHITYERDNFKYLSLMSGNISTCLYRVVIIFLCSSENIAYKKAIFGLIGKILSGVAVIVRQRSINIFFARSFRNFPISPIQANRSWSGDFKKVDSELDACNDNLI